MDFAHNSGLIHGQFDLSQVVLEKDKDNDNILYKVTNFAPQFSMQ